MCLLTVWMRGNSRGPSQRISHSADSRDEGLALSFEPLLRFPSPHPALTIRLALENTSKRLFLHFWSLLPTRGTGVLSITIPCWGSGTTSIGQQDTRNEEDPYRDGGRGSIGATDLPEVPYAELESRGIHAGGLVVCERVPVAA